MSASSAPEIYLIDGSAYIYRAYHAIRPLSNAQGLPTHAVYGFTTILGRLLREREPQYLAIAFDTRGPVFRHALYADYKANRPPMPEDLAVQIPYIRKLAAAYRICSLEQSGQEADDLIASATEALHRQGFAVVIVSGDKDLLQLVRPGVSLWDPMNDRVMDEAAVQEKYGLPPGQLLDYFALTGDNSDNIPGVPGIGPKSAQKLISEHSTLEGVFAALPAMKASKNQRQLAAHQQEAFLSRDLVRLNLEAPVPTELQAYQMQQPDIPDLNDLLRELGFHSLLKDEAPQAAAIDTTNFHLLQEATALPALAQRLAQVELLALDTETDSLNTLTTHLVGVSLCTEEGTAWYLPCGHRDAEGTLLPGQLPLEALVRLLRPLLARPELLLIGHNLKFDLEVLARPQNGGLQVQTALYDTMLGAWLLDPDRNSYKLDDLCRQNGLAMTSFAEATAGDKAADAFCRVPLEAAKNYSCEDVFAAITLHQLQAPLLAEVGLDRVMREVETPLIPVLADMEQRGIRLDIEELQRLAVEFEARLQDYEATIYRVAGQEFNINSPKQLGEILFDQLQLPKGRKTKTGWSTDVKILEQLSSVHELPALILQYRNLAKLQSTYVDKLAASCRNSSSRVHTSYNQCGTATGRLSSSNPNLQNIPIRTEEGRRIRAAFIAADGCRLLAADYSQIDLRVLAHYSEDAALIEAFRSGQDIHSRTASEIFQVMPELITSEMRRSAKAINFGIVYGMSSFGLSSQLKISRKDAQTFIDRYLAHFAGVKRFMETIVLQAREEGFVSTLLGRRRFLADINSKNRNQREFAERAAINTPIQGSAADIIKLAMLSIHQALQDNGLRARMLLQIHDELIVETPVEELTAVRLLVQEHMEGAFKLRVPLLVHVSDELSLAKGE